ncbi:D-glycero-beta-D-manno-heptose-7-phosphate kinase [bacterium]|nr:D-glycero-beta-D-manno-heptose-7-phosphate kinase [bacterium]
MDQISLQRSRQILNRAQGQRIAVVGDLILDRYLWGHVSRISPEAPVPVVEVESETIGLGGAGNVINNLQTLGALPIPFGAVGKDSAGEVLFGILQNICGDTQGILQVSTRPTSEKTRIIASDQHVVRADRESVVDLKKDEEDALIAALKKVIPNVAAIIIQDYNKGIVTPRVIEGTINAAKQHNIPIAVDPKFDNFFAFKGVTVFKPNIKEIESALGIRISNNSQMEDAGRSLFQKLGCKHILITRGEQGMTIFHDADHVEHIRTRARKVHDVSGAGDTVISTLVVAMTGGADLKESAVLANYAAGVVCGEVGVVPIERDRLLTMIEHDHE